MPEVAINIPFESQEVIDIILDELKTRLRGLSPLTGAKEYVAFSVDFQVKIRLRRSGETVVDEKETLAWGNTSAGDVGTVLQLEDLIAADEASHFESRDPNEERIARDMPLTVEGNDGKGGKARRKVRVKGA